MYHQLCYHSALIIVLLTLYCYASPIDQNQQSEILEQIISKHKLDRFKTLCVIYGHCNVDDNQEIIEYDNAAKQKRLSSSLFHGIPKFGKRAFTSAFAGLPKFG